MSGNSINDSDLYASISVQGSRITGNVSYHYNTNELDSIKDVEWATNSNYQRLQRLKRKLRRYEIKREVLVSILELVSKLSAIGLFYFCARLLSGPFEGMGHEVVIGAPFVLILLVFCLILPAREYRRKIETLELQIDAMEDLQRQLYKKQAVMELYE